jgi:hypothetical protein
VLPGHEKIGLLFHVDGKRRFSNEQTSENSHLRITIEIGFLLDAKN